MSDILDRLLADVAHLRARVDAIEGSANRSKTVRGFTAAARVLDVGVSTVHRRFRADPRFPRPSRVNPNKLGRTCPEWTLSSLINHKTQKQ